MSYARGVIRILTALAANTTMPGARCVTWFKRGKSMGPSEKPEVSEDEERQIRDEIEFWVRGSGDMAKRLHIPANGNVEPICTTTIGHKSRGRSEYYTDIEWIRKELAVFPLGYCPICRGCAERWREL